MSIRCGIEGCVKSFDPNHIARHRSTHLEKTVSCHSCEQKFANKEYLSKHIKRHHKKETKLCEYCGKEFSNPTLFTRHKSIRDKFDHSCDYCCMSFKLFSNLEHHLKAEHPGIPETNSNQSSGEADVSMDQLRNTEQTNQQGPSTSCIERTSTGNVTVKRQRMNSEHIETGPTRDSSQGEDDERQVVPPTQPAVLKKSVTFAEQKKDSDEGPDCMGPTQLPTAQDTDRQPEQEELFECSQQLDMDDGSDQQRTSVVNSGVIRQGSLGDGISPISNVTGIQRVIPTQTDPLPAGNDFDAFFALKMWGLVRDRMFYDNFQQQHPNVDPSILKTILDYLTDTRSFADNDQLYSFLNKKPQEFTGYFLVAALVVDYCFRTDPRNVMDLSMSTVLLCPEFEQVVDKTAQYILQRSKRVDVAQVVENDKIPRDVLDKIDYNFIQFYTSDEEKVATAFENQLSSELGMHLSDLLFLDVKTKKAKLLDPSMEPLDRAQLWTQLQQIVINMRNSTPRPALFETLLLHHLERQYFTTEYLKIKSGPSSTRVHFHDGVVARFGGKEPENQEEVSATEDDVKTFTTMLYTDYKAEQVIPKISVGVFNVATHLRFDNVWQFLFRDQTLEDVLKIGDKMAILQIIIRLRNDELAAKVAANFENYFPANERSQVFVGLSHEDFLYFFERDTQTISEMEKYTIIVQWSFKMAGIPYSVKFNPAVKIHFDPLRCLVKLENLDDSSLVTVASHGLVPLDAIKIARRMRNAN